MRYDDFMRRMLLAFPYAEAGQDNDGQLVVYTGLTEVGGIGEGSDDHEAENVVPIELDDRDWDFPIIDGRPRKVTVKRTINDTAFDDEFMLTPMLVLTRKVDRGHGRDDEQIIGFFVTEEQVRENFMGLDVVIVPQEGE